MRCEEFREKYINDEMTDQEKLQFEDHLKVCESCKIFVQNYQKIKDGLKLLYTFKPSKALEESVISKIHRKAVMKKGLIFGLPGAAAVAVSMIMVFYVFSPAVNSNFAYEKAVSAGISLLKSEPGTTLTYAQAGNSNLDYLLKIKYVSDQF
ncbi:anti-sigma factor family protein [Athalassotoga sp.]|uniref:anti-sigma factor family protein n=1 Tax=Athalassotoga sp. TaxID=2022597 RepID=UPI003D02A953